MTTDGHRTYVYAAVTHTAIVDPSIDPIHKFWRRAEGEDEWQEITPGLPDKPKVRSALVHPQRPNIVFAGTRVGVYRSDDRGDHWEALDTPKDLVCALTFHPQDPSIIFAGFDQGTHTSAGIIRSDDGGATWWEVNTERVTFPHITQNLPAQNSESDSPALRPTLKVVTGFAFDPSNPMEMYASIEIGGLLASRDGGESWEQLIDGPFLSIRTLDTHAVGVSRAAPGNVFINTCVGMFRSRDRGHHWEHVPIKNGYTLVMENREFPYGGAYCRGMVMAPDDPKTIYTTASCDGAVLPGTDHKGAAFRTRDLGETWEQLDVGEVPYRNISAITLDQAAPSHVYCLSGMGRGLQQPRRRRYLQHKPGAA